MTATVEAASTAAVETVPTTALKTASATPTSEGRSGAITTRAGAASTVYRAGSVILLKARTSEAIPLA